MDFKKLPNETDEAFVFRVCSQKDQIGNWSKVAAVLNDELNKDLSCDAYRKKYRRMSESETASECMFVSQPSCMDDEDAVNRQKLLADKLEVNRFIRQQSRFELFYEKVRDVIKALDPPEMLPIDYCETSKEYVLTISDIHYGSTFSSHNNVYSRDIAKTRMSTLLGGVVDHVVNNKIARVSVVGLGDDIQGILRLSDLQLNDCAVVDCVVEVARLLASFLNELSRVAYVDYYAVSASNHSQTRSLGSKASELAGEDVERIIVSYINDVLINNDRVNVHYDTSKDYISFNIFEFNAVAMHGHQLKNMDTAIKDVSAIHQVFYDYMFVGHYHSAQEINVGERGDHNVEVLISPSIIGSCPYADKIMKGGKSSAKLYEFDRRYGHVGSKTFILN